MNIEQELSRSSGWADGTNGLYGYFDLKTANFLVSTGKFKFQQSTPFGYILKEVKV